jgi:hypothetical protein
MNSKSREKKRKIIPIIRNSRSGKQEMHNGKRSVGKMEQIDLKLMRKVRSRIRLLRDRMLRRDLKRRNGIQISHLYCSNYGKDAERKFARIRIHASQATPDLKVRTRLQLSSPLSKC